MAEAMDILRRESVQAIQDLRRLLAEARAGSAHQGQKPREMNFINSKSFEGGQFSGTARESHKSLSENLKIYFNPKAWAPADP